MFLQLTQASTGNPIYINTNQVTAIYHVDREYASQNPGCGESVIEFVGGDSVQVTEAPNIILSCIPNPPGITPA